MRQLPLHILLLLTASLAILGCKRAPATSSAAVERKAPTSKIPSRPPEAFTILVIAQLRPNLLTHLAADRIGNTYWTQESADLHDILFASGAGTDAPLATRLSSGNILAALGASDSALAADKAAGGSIQSIAVGLDGNVYFYFTGGVGANVLAGLGRYNSRDGITILADSHALANASGMGVSLSLARGKLLFSDDLPRDRSDASNLRQHTRLWLRHSDASVILDFDATRFYPARPESLAIHPTLTQPISVVDLPLDPRTQTDERATARATNIDLTRDDIDLFSPTTPPTSSTKELGNNTANDSSDRMLIVDKRLGRLLRLDVATAEARLAASLVLVPNALGEPALDGRGNILLFVGESDVVINPQVPECPDPSAVHTAFPAIFVVGADPRHITAISPDNLRSPSGFAVHALHLRQFTPLATDTYLTFDTTSGQILKLTGTAH